MPLIADRFLVEQDDVVDLATGETVRLSIEAGPRRNARARLCDRLFAVRHPLLLPLLDYGACARGWFEAHASRPVHRTSGVDARTSALHLVRFLRQCGIDLDAAAAARNVRPAVDMPALAPHRPIAVRLQARPSLEAVRTVLESTGPPGVTSMAIYGAIGAGLRTARLQVARAARLAGYVVIDSRFGALDEVLKPARHYCVIDWLSRETTLPPLLSVAACAGARRHAWIRFCRHPVDDAGSIGLEPLMTRELTNAIYLDAECGPTATEVQAAVSAAGGLPGPTIDVLTAFGGRQGISWVHETAPEYVVRDRVSPDVARVASGGIARLERAVEAAHALARRGRHARAARVLQRCGTALAARGANRAAAEAACSLGGLHLDRGRLDAALEAFQRAQTWCQGEPSVAARALIGSGRALLEQGRIVDAEGVFRTACLAGAASASGAKRWLAETLILRGRVEAAEEALDQSDPALSSTIARLQGDIAAASRAAGRALEVTGRDPAGECAAHLAMAHVQAALGSLDGVRRHGAAAEALSRRLRSPAQRLRVAAEVLACLDQCGVRNQPARDRLLRAAKRMPPLAAARTRAVLGAATPADASLIAVSPGTSDLIHRFRSLITAIHDAPDESAALQAIVTDLHASLDACSVIIRSAVLGRVVAGTGRTWAGEEAFTKPALDGGGSILQAGVTPEAAEPVVAGGAILGVIGVRWVTGARPPAARVRDVLRTAAVATAPMLRGLHLPVRAPAGAEAAYPDALLGPGPSAERVREAIRRAALAPYPVLIEGESGR